MNAKGQRLKAKVADIPPSAFMLHPFVRALPADLDKAFKGNL